jgi:hypothetical protein
VAVGPSHFGHMPPWYSSPFVSPARLSGLLLYLTAMSTTPSCVRLIGERTQRLGLGLGIGIRSLHASSVGSRGQWGGWFSEVKEEKRAKPDSGDTNGTIYPADLGPHKLLHAIPR